MSEAHHRRVKKTRADSWKLSQAHRSAISTRTMQRVRRVGKMQAQIRESSQAGRSATTEGVKRVGETLAAARQVTSTSINITHAAWTTQRAMMRGKNTRRSKRVVTRRWISHCTAMPRTCQSCDPGAHAACRRRGCRQSTRKDRRGSTHARWLRSTRPSTVHYNSQHRHHMSVQRRQTCCSLQDGAKRRVLHNTDGCCGLRDVQWRRVFAILWEVQWRCVFVTNLNLNLPWPFRQRRRHCLPRTSRGRTTRVGSIIKCRRVSVLARREGPRIRTKDTPAHRDIQRHTEPQRGIEA